MALYEMRKFVAPEFIFGVGARHRVGYYARNMAAKRVLIVSDIGVVAAGWVAEAISDLEEMGIESVVFTGLTSNPKDHEVMLGAEYYREQECDVIVAVGGGSVIDCAKAIGIVNTNEKHILDFEGIDHVDIPGPPLICIPTTAGTAADISQFCIIMNSEERYKVAIISKSVVPDVALIDPETTTTLDKGLTACTGVDALTHAIEAYVSTASSPIVDIHALTAIKLIWENIETAVALPHKIESRENMLLGTLQAGLAFSNASLGAVHAMAHSLGGYLDLPHGECNALLLDHVIRFNMKNSGERYKQIAHAIGLDTSGLSTVQCTNRITQMISDLRDRVGIVNRLSLVGVHTTDIPDLANHAYNDACIVTNPRHASLADIKAIYGEAM
ncbi:iron-containing alcohol dehydrogenase [Vibrio sp.]|uniref:Iron-containing alcohol dehydrogenase n=1 Tax=Vibrio viridaestus TaxID=2487322 RepID=A0A3N9TK13_9VIBR|nr:alcohol dehydrogenase-like regulatory protein ErcA [Vibrio viridaestus]MDC0612619.1 iron-containing alcohol dehydrogenase [Vibrio sp.]RQW64570.1 iron-containing alcohol dehydrogenase [Vibrio viridaestus]